MAKAKQQGDWWETLLYVGLFLLIAMFLYQLLKLWNAGTATAGNALTSFGQAFTNTVTELENGLTTLLTSPFTALSSLFGGIPFFLSLLFSFATSLLSGNIFATIGTFFGSIFGSSGSAPLTTGLGASFGGSLPVSTGSDTPAPAGASIGTNDGGTFQTGAFTVAGQ